MPGESIGAVQGIRKNQHILGHLSQQAFACRRLLVKTELVSVLLLLLLLLRLLHLLLLLLSVEQGVHCRRAKRLPMLILPAARLGRPVLGLR